MKTDLLNLLGVAAGVAAFNWAINKAGSWLRTRRARRAYIVAVAYEIYGVRSRWWQTERDIRKACEAATQVYRNIPIRQAVVVGEAARERVASATDRNMN